MNMNDMPRHTMTCRMCPEPAALERVLQVVRKRGFAVERLSAEHDARGLRIHMTLAGARCPDMLRAQLEKLHGVHSVWLQHAARRASNEGMAAAALAQPAG